MRVQFWHGTYRVRKPIPKALQAIIGRGAYLTESLRTADERESDKRALPVLATFQAMLDKGQVAWELEQRRSIACADLSALDRQPIERLICHPRHAASVLTRFQEAVGVEPPISAVPRLLVTFAANIERWATFTGASKKGRQDLETKVGKFVEWLEHDNMAAVVFEDGRDWRDEMIAAGELSPKSISNYLKAVKALFGHAYDNEHIKGDNPMARVKYDPGEGRKRDDFTIEERRTILLAAREAEPDIKWLTFLSAYALTRTSEIADAHTRDIVCEGGVWLLKVRRKNRSKDQRTKTPQSTRDVALHSALLDEGFLVYRESVGDGPLFPNLRIDGYGKRAGQAATDLSDWLRNVVKMTDPDKPFYSLRHSGITDLRTARAPDGSPAVKDDVERYLTAHGKKDQHGNYGTYPATELKAAIEWVRNPLILRSASV